MSEYVLLTGAAGGIGKSIASVFKNAGWSVIGLDIVDYDKNDFEYFFKLDISDPVEIVKVRDKIQDLGIDLSCIINNAAVQVEKTLIDTTIEEWNRVFNVNVSSIFLITKYFTESLLKGSIINISSVHALATSKGLASYAASKGAVSAFTRAMALELADKGIRVNAICPGAVDTPMLREGLKRNTDSESAMGKLINAAPLKKIGIPEDVAQLALFLADNHLSGNITGQEFICDSGILAKLASE